MKRCHLLSFLWLVFAVFSSCSHEIELVDLRTEALVDSQDSLNTTVLFSAKADTASVTVHSDGKWKVEAVNDRASSWLTFSPEKGGKGDTRVKIDVTENDEYEERSAVLHFRSGKKERIIQVVQKPYKAFLVSSEKAEFGPSGGKFEVKVTSNVAYSMSIEDAPWLHQIITKGVVNVLEFQVDPTDRADKRIGRLVFTSELGTETVMVYQTGVSPEMVLSANDISVPSEGCQIRVDVSSNFNAEYSISADWVHEIATKAVSTNTFYFYVERNPEYDARTAEIVFFDAAKNLSGTVTIHQAQQDAIVIQNELKIDYKSQVFNLTVGSNVDVTMTIPEQYDWLVPVKTRGYSENTLSFSVAKNNSKEIREADIIFTSGDLRQSVRVVQMPTTSFPRTIEKIRESEQISLSIGREIEGIVPTISGGFTDTIDMDALTTAISSIEDVFSATLEESGNMITIMMRDSTIIRYVKTWGDESDDEDLIDSNDFIIQSIKNAPVAVKASDNDRKALLLSPYQNSFKNKDDHEEGNFNVDDKLIRRELASIGISLEFCPDSEASLDKFTGEYMSSFDFVIIRTHGGNKTTGFKCTVLSTGNAVGEYPEDKTDIYDRIEKEITHGFPNMRYIATSTWLDSTFSESLHDAIVYVGSCHSYDQEEEDLKDVFIRHGASAYYGFDGTIVTSISNKLLYSITRSLCRGMNVNNARSFVSVEKELQTDAFRRSVAEHPYSFRLNPETKDRNVFLIDPRPTGLKSTVYDFIAFLQWDCNSPSGQYKYVVKAGEKDYELPLTSSRQILTPFDKPGTYPWSVGIDIYAETIRSDTPVIVASYHTDGEPFTIKNTVSVITDDVSDISIKKATVSAHYNATFTAEIQEQGFLFSSSNTEPLYNGSGCKKQLANADGNPFSCALTGLEPLTKYYVRAYVIVGKNEMKQIFYGNVRSFTTDPIKNVIPDDILDQMDDYIPIYEGKNPPNVEGQYLLSPSELVYDSTHGFNIGHIFDDLYFQFLNQDMDNNTLDYVEEQGNSSQVGTGAFISGEGDRFSVFFNTDGNAVYDDYSFWYKTALVISGIKTAEGIKELDYAFVMVDKGDDPKPYYISRGSFRVFKDGDGLSTNTNYFSRRTSAPLKPMSYNPTPLPSMFEVEHN